MSTVTRFRERMFWATQAGEEALEQLEAIRLQLDPVRLTFGASSGPQRPETDAEVLGRLLADSEELLVLERMLEPVHETLPDCTSNATVVELLLVERATRQMAALAPVARGSVDGATTATEAAVPPACSAPAKSLNKLAEECFLMACSKGWYGGYAQQIAERRGMEHIVTCRDMADKLPTPERLMLMVTELAEAMEEYRNGHTETEVYYPEHGAGVGEAPGAIQKKPEGIPVELADVLIRIFDFAGAHGIDLDAAVRTKMAYNSTRPVRHGGKKA